MDYISRKKRFHNFEGTLRRKKNLTVDYDCNNLTLKKVQCSHATSFAQMEQLLELETHFLKEVSKYKDLIPFESKKVLDSINRDREEF